MKTILILSVLLTIASCGNRNCRKSTRIAAQKYNHLNCSQRSYDAYCSRDISEQRLDYSSFYSPNCYNTYVSCLGLGNNPRRRRF